MKILLDARFRFIFLMVLITVGIFAKLGDTDLPPIASALYASISREMVRSYDWLTPRLPHCPNVAYRDNWSEFYDHPPLLFWSTAVVFKIFGANDFTARLASEIYGIGVILLVYYLGYLISGHWAAFFSAIVLITTPLFIQQTRACELETILMFFIMLSIISFILGIKKDKKYFLLFGISTGLGFLGKGIPAYATYVTAILYIILAKKWELFKCRHLWAGFILGLVVPLFWIVPQFIFEGDKFYQLYIKRQVFGSIAGRGVVLPIGKKIFGYFYFIPPLFSHYLPWGPVGVLAIYKILRKRLWTEEIMTLLLLIAVIFVAFSIPGYKEIYYLLPMWPSWAVIIGYVSGTWFATEGSRKKTMMVMLALFFTFCVFWIFFPSIWGIRRFPEFPVMAGRMKEIVPKKESVFIYRLNYWDMVGMFPWYFDRGISENIESEEKLQKLVASRPGRKKYFFTRKTEYDGIGEQARKNTEIIYEFKRFVLFTNKKGR